MYFYQAHPRRVFQEVCPFHLKLIQKFALNGIPNVYIDQDQQICGRKHILTAAMWFCLENISKIRIHQTSSVP